MSRKVWNFTGQEIRFGSSTATPIPADGYAQIVHAFGRENGAVLDLGDGTRISGKCYRRGAQALSAPWIKGSKNHDPNVKVNEGDVVIVNARVAEFGIDTTLRLDVAVEVWVPGEVKRDAGVPYAACPEFYEDLSPSHR